MVKVKVPRGALNRFVTLEYKVEKNDETGEIIGVHPQYKLDRDSVLDAWLRAGASLQWNDV